MMKINLEPRFRGAHVKRVKKMQMKARALQKKIRKKYSHNQSRIRNGLETIQRAKYGDAGYEQHKAIKTHVTKVRGRWLFGSIVMLSLLVVFLNPWLNDAFWLRVSLCWLSVAGYRAVWKWHVKRVQQMADAELRLAGLTDITERAFVGAMLTRAMTKYKP